MKIALVSDWFAPRRGGIESQLMELGAALTSAGHEITLITAQPDAAPAPFHVEELAVKRLPGLQTAASFSLPGVLENRLLELAPQVVHIHSSIVAPTCLAALIAARRVNVPVVFTAHSDFSVMRPFLAVFRQMFPKAAQNVLPTGVSSVIAEQVQWLNPHVLAEVCPNGFDAGNWSFRPNSDDTQLHIVSAMRLERKKRPQILTRMQKAIERATGIAPKVTIAGEGKLADKLPQYIQQPGWLSAVELADLYASADFFVMPSKYEAFGIAALEASAAGLPVLGRSKTGLVDFIKEGENGRLCDSDSDLIEAAVQLSKDALLRKAMSGSNKRVQAFDWSVVVDRHLDLYEQALELRKPWCVAHQLKRVTARFEPPE